MYLLQEKMSQIKFFAVLKETSFKSCLVLLRFFFFFYEFFPSRHAARDEFIGLRIVYWYFLRLDFDWMSFKNYPRGTYQETIVLSFIFETHSKCNRHVHLEEKKKRSFKKKWKSLWKHVHPCRQNLWQIERCFPESKVSFYLKKYSFYNEKFRE